MGNSNKKYPGFSDVGQPSCQSTGWIMTPGVGIDEIKDEYILKLYRGMLELAKEAELEVPEEKAWWLLRWTNFGENGNVKDVDARKKFLKKYIQPPYFLPYEDALLLSKKNPEKVVASLRDTIPGNVILTYWTKTGQRMNFEMYNVNREWFKSQDSLLTIAKKVFERKSLKLLKDLHI